MIDVSQHETPVTDGRSVASDRLTARIDEEVTA